jgi:hypothetical protein
MENQRGRLRAFCIFRGAVKEGLTIEHRVKLLGKVEAICFSEPFMFEFLISSIPYLSTGPAAIEESLALAREQLWIGTTRLCFHLRQFRQKKP